jgi:MFS family permease
MDQRWRVTGATLGAQALQAGFLYYGFGTLAVAMEPALGSSRRAIMLAPAFLSVATNLAFPWAGRLVDRQSLRRLVLVGLASLALGGAALATVTATWQVYVVFGLLLPAANLFLGQLTASALVTRWFDEGRGRALGVSAAGTSVGGFLFPVLIAALTARWGWRAGAALITVVPALLMTPVVLAWVQDPPAPARAAAAAGGWRDLVGQRAFWCQTVAVGTGLFCYHGTLANLVPHAVAVGLPLAQAAGLMSIVAVTALGGKLAFGLLADRVDLRVAYGLALAAMAGAFALLALERAGPALTTGAVLLGLAAGGLLPVWAGLVARCFGTARVGQALGAMNLAMAPLTIMAAPYAGWTFDATGSYRAAFLSYLALLAIGAAALALLRLPEETRGGLP